jgi:hypothetical protein
MTYVISSFLVIFGIIGLIGLIFKIQKEAKEELLKTLFKKNEITSEVYKKYIDNL